MVSLEPFYCVILGKAKLVVSAGVAHGSLIGNHPELPAYAAWKFGLILLGDMLENRTPFLEAFTRTERNSHIDIADLRLLPDPAVKPDRALLHPVTVDALIQGLFDGVPADSVGPGRVGKGSCSIDLMRFDFLHDIHIQLYILLSEDRKSTRLNSSHVANSYAVF